MAELLSQAEIDAMLAKGADAYKDVKVNPKSSASKPAPVPGGSISPADQAAFLFDVPVEIYVEYASCKIPLRDILTMRPGTIVEMERLLQVSHQE